MRRQAMLASSCSQLEMVGGATSQQCSSIPEIRVRLCTPSRQGFVSASAAPPVSSSSVANEQGSQGNGLPLPSQPLYLRRRGGKGLKDENLRRDGDGLPPLLRSHSEPGLSSSNDTGRPHSHHHTHINISFRAVFFSSYSLGPKMGSSRPTSGGSPYDKSSNVIMCPKPGVREYISHWGPPSPAKKV